MSFVFSYVVIYLSYIMLVVHCTNHLDKRLNRVMILNILKFQKYFGINGSERKDYEWSFVLRNHHRLKNHQRIKEPENKSLSVGFFSDPLIQVTFVEL